MAAALDELDRNILALLQEDSSLPLDEIARKVGASKTPVWNRIRKMKASGLIRAEVALVDPEKLGLESCFFVLIRTSQHDAAWLDRFLKAVQARPEVMEAHRLAGDIDYILKVRVANARAYDAFYRALIKEVSIFNVTSALSMEEIKSTTALPVPDRRGGLTPPARRAKREPEPLRGAREHADRRDHPGLQRVAADRRVRRRRDQGAGVPLDHVQPPGRRGSGPARTSPRSGPRRSGWASPSPSCR